MTRIKSQIRHDYKSLATSAIRKADSHGGKHRWFWAGLGAPLILLAALLVWQSQTQKAGAAISQSIEEPAIVPLALPQQASVTIAAGTASTPAPKGADRVELTIRSGDTLDELFKKNSLSRGDLASILALKLAKDTLTLVIPGDQIDIWHRDGAVVELRRPMDEVRTLQVVRNDDGFTTNVLEKPVEIRVRHATAQIDSSLFIAAKDVGVSDTLTMNLAGIFAWDVDFVLDIRRGDRFTVLYEELWQDGERLRDGDILVAEFVNNGSAFRAVRYADPDGNIGYFTPDGHNVRKAFLRAPIAFNPRVTSNFNPRRRHPVHKKVRPHRGVDYGAPTGTAIKSAGDGKIAFRGRKGGYGNCVIVQHGGNISTLYAHMSNFNRTARLGSRVKQGQTIGYVGATGTATGAHLHYEYRVNGVHRNPRTVKLPKAKPIPDKFSADFQAATKPLLSQLDLVTRTTQLAAKN